MGSKCGIPVFLFLFLCLSLPSFAAEKVYTNADLRPPAPSSAKNSRIDPVTGKVISVADAAPRDRSRSERWRRSVMRIAAGAKHQAEMAVNEIRTNMVALAAVIAFLVLIWAGCLVDILRNEFRGNNKLIWFVAVTFIPLAGCVLYFLIGRRQRKYRFIRDYE